MLRLENQVAIITGGSRGIGRAVALRLAQTHAIVAVARDQARLESACEEIRAAGGEGRALPIDLTNRDAIARALANVDADVVVNNAGVITKKPLLRMMPDEWQEMMDVNISAIFHVTRALLPGMIDRRRGHIINIASIAGRSAFPGGTGYVATKHAVLGFSRSLMLEVRSQGVRVIAVCPGSVDTDLIRPLGRDAGRILQPSDVADAILAAVRLPARAMVSELDIRPSNP